MEEHYSILKQKYNTLIKSEYLCFNDIALKKNIMGIYIIYSEYNEVIYVGSTNNFNVRFGIDLKHEATHTLMKKFLRNGVFADRVLAKYYLINICKFKIVECSTKREAEAIEHFAIWLLNPTYNK